MRSPRPAAYKVVWYIYGPHDFSDEASAHVVALPAQLSPRLYCYPRTRDTSCVILSNHLRHMRLAGGGPADEAWRSGAATADGTSVACAQVIAYSLAPEL